MAKCFLAFFLLTSAISQAQTLLRGPYLQVVTPTSIVIRWRTDAVSDSRVNFGSQAASLTQQVTIDESVTEHEVKLSSLQSGTKYYYSIGSSSTVLQGNTDNYFETAPLAGTKGKYRFGVLGDCGTNSAIQGNVRDQMAAYLGSNYMNALLLLGDNAYALGYDHEYQSNFFLHYKDNFLKKNPVFPTPGNHDYLNDNFDRQNDHVIPYYDIFTMPTQAEAGGKASGTESYYSFDYGNIHFLSLDSYGREDYATRLYDVNGKQAKWVVQDLQENQNKDWVIAYWHHPPYSQGSRNSETDPEMTSIRENFIKLLEDKGVDLILCGHSHVYERSRLMKGHYGKMNTFNAATHNISSSSGLYDGSDNSCPYIKSAASNTGTVYVVSGSAGHLGTPAAGYPHSAMFYSNYTTGGGMILEIEGNRLDAKWVDQNGTVADKFTIEKDVNKTKTIEIENGESTTLSPSFIGNYIWNSGATTRTIEVSPSADTDYSVKDDKNCITDVFSVKVNGALPVKLVSFDGTTDVKNLVTLNWVTSAEKNAAYFGIERSTDGRNFTEIARVSAKNEAGNYRFKNEASVESGITEHIYYRLNIVDIDGKQEYSRIISIKLNKDDKTPGFELAPNPSASEGLKIRVTDKVPVSAGIFVSDITGKVLLDKQIVITSDYSSFLPKKLPAGLYIITVTIQGRQVTKKIMIN